MFPRTVIVVLSVVVCASSAPLTCSAAVEYFSSEIDTTLLWQSPSIAPDGACSLPSTCCSPPAIAALKAIASSRHRAHVSALTAAARGSCFSEQVQSTVTSFLTAEKASMREKALLFLQTYYTSELGQIFDRFVDSTEDFILGNKPLCGLEELIPELAFSVFWPFVKRVYPELNTTSPAYQECAKQFVNDRYTTNIEETRRSFEQPLLRVARLFQYRNALLSTVSELEREDLSEACLVDLVAAQYCEGCSGMHSEALDTCLLQCKSAVGSCLKPYEALSDIIRDWSLYARELSEAVTTFNPDYMFSSVPWRILDIAADVTLPGSTVKAEMDARCAGTDRRKRSTRGLFAPVLRPSSSAIRMRRQSAASLHTVAQREIDCLTTLVASLSHETMATALCVNASSTGPCDSSVMLSSNLPILLSEVLGNAVQNLNWQRKYILAVVFRCDEAQHGVCPDVWNYCWEEPLPPTPTATSTASVQPSTSSLAASSSPPTTSTHPTVTTTRPLVATTTIATSATTTTVLLATTTIATSATTTTVLLPTTTPPPPCSNTGEEFPDQGPGDSELGPGSCLPTTATTASPQPTVPRVDERTGGGVGIQDGCPCLTAILTLLVAALIWAY